MRSSPDVIRALLAAWALFLPLQGVILTSQADGAAEPDGRELTLVYLGASTCVPCAAQEMKAAVRRALHVVEDRARAMKLSYSTVGVATDRSVKASRSRRS